MKAKNVHNVAIHFSEKEMEKLSAMLFKKVKTFPKIKKTKGKPITKKEVNKLFA